MKCKVGKIVCMRFQAGCTRLLRVAIAGPVPDTVMNYMPSQHRAAMHRLNCCQL